MPMRRSRIVALLGAVALTLGLAACASSEESSGGTRAVQTEQGTVEVPTDPERVVLLNYALAGYLYDLDVPVVAMTPEHTEAEGEFASAWKSDAEEQGTEWLPWDADGFDVEAIMAQDPDLIIAGGIGFPLRHATEAYDELSQVAPTVIVSGDKTEWQQQFEFLADQVFDRPAVYRDAVQAYDARVAEVREAITVPPGESAFLSMMADGRVYVLVEDRGLPKEFAELGFRPAPLFAGGGFEPYVAGGDSFALSTEQVGQVLTMDTLFLIGFQNHASWVDELREKPIFAQLPAFEKNQAYDLPYWAQRGDFDEAMELLNIVEQTFGKQG
ncbi:Fe2+-enterobactin ABC transporter substrate-binding protein [Gordonia caeni]|uniref:Fe2+-enterobactin ABC transporter substrate-binding protein n=2 Tax=Gordonia caeni TaxID=1007097 RepID=A0ABP7NY77_9ACTN